MENHLKHHEKYTKNFQKFCPPFFAFYIDLSLYFTSPSLHLELKASTELWDRISGTANMAQRKWPSYAEWPVDRSVDTPYSVHGTLCQGVVVPIHFRTSHFYIHSSNYCRKVGFQCRHSQIVSRAEIRLDDKPASDPRNQQPTHAASLSIFIGL